MIPVWLQAGLWGLFSGGALLIGAAIGYRVDFISNIPEGISSSVGMKRSGRSAAFIFGIWGTITLISGLAALAGYSVFDGFSHEMRAATTATAAGAILAMIADTMLPEAFEGAHNLSGLITAAGFLCAFALSMMAS